MSRTGIAAGLTGLLALALAVAPVSPSQATRAPSDGARIAAAGTPDEPLLRARTAKPSVTKLTPQSGPTAGGLDVVIKGDYLAGVKRVLFGATKATKVRVKNAHKLIVRAPPHEAGVVRVRVVTKQGSSKQSAATHFTYVTPPPALSGLSPRTGPTAGGTTVTITGSSLVGATGVRFGSTSATSFRVTSPTTIAAVSPGRPVGPVNITVTTAGGSATLDDAYAFVPPPTLTSVAPGSGPTNGATVTLTGAGFTSDAAVTFGGAPATNVQIFAGGTQLTATTPDHAPGWVDVVVATAGGSATLARGYLFVGGVTLDSVSPPEGPASGGVNVTLTGSGFTADTLVVFGTKPSLVTTANPAGTQLTALLPAQAAGTVDVHVSNEGDSETLVGGFTYVVAPALTAVSPDAGPVAGGTTVTLTGTGFRAGMQVGFGGVAGTGVTVGSATQATVTTPPHVAGAVHVTVTTPGGSATAASGYTYVVPPTLAAVSPDAGPTAGGTTVTLTGTGFRAGMQVSFGGVAGGGVTISSATQATVTTPPHAAGAVHVTVTTPGGSATAANAYTYVVPPTLTTLSPDAGPTAGGTTVTLTGTGFRAGMQVSFGGVAGTGVTVGSATQATVTTPPHAAGAVHVMVTTPGGSDTVANGFAYLAAPTLGSVSPVAGPTAGGTAVTLSGTGFRTGMQVSFGGVPATGVSVSPGGTQLTAVTPAHAAGAVSVSVTTPGGADSLSGAYTYVVLPAVTDVTPDAGPVSGGTTVTLTGAGFRDGTQVLFGSTPATGVSVNPAGTELTASTPPHPAGAVNVSVSTPGGSATLLDGYTYVAPPTLSVVSPDAGPVAGGTTVTLTGSGFRPGMQVLFGTAAATGVSVDPGGTRLTALAPAHAPGGVDVSVTTPGGSATLGNSYTYLVAPTLTSVSPAEGPASGGTTVSLTGAGFRAGMQVSVGGTPAAIVSINPAGTSLTATTAAHAAGLVAVSVTTPGGSDTLAGSFTYVAAPTLTAVNPTVGPEAGGTLVTLTGTGLTGATAVTFDGTAATSVTVVDATTITALTPGHPAGLVDVSVTTVGGSGTLDDAFTYFAEPTLASVSPVEGPIAGGTTVTITGTGLTGTTDVTFGGVPATGVLVVDDSTVTATTPSNAAGVVDVALMTPGGSDTLANAFTYVAAPTIAAVSPADGPAAGGTSVTITGTGLIGTTEVTFDGAPAPGLVVVSDTEVTVDTPAQTAGLADVELTTPGGTALVTGGFTYLS